MLKKIGLAIITFVFVITVFVAIQPADFRVERSIAISTAPETPYALVNDFHSWKSWSPWASIDPNQTESFAGAPSGTGAIYRWSGNQEVGEGSMTILDSRINELVQIRLDFLRPFKDTNTAEFSFKPQGTQTIVTWAMFGKKTFISKAVCLVMNMDRMLGGEFEKGLSKLKQRAESGPM